MIETERLMIKPLTYEQLLKYIKCDNSLEADSLMNFKGAAHRNIDREVSAD
jgi:hypothetical protein